VSDGRKRLWGALSTLCLTALGTSVLSATPSSAEPTIADVRERVATLYHEAEQASERVNDARLRLRSARADLDRVSKRLQRQRSEYDAVRDQVVATVRAQVEGETLVTTSQVLLSEDADTFIHQMTTVDEYTQRQTELARRLREQAEVLDAREARAERIVAAIADDRAALVEDKAEIEGKAGAAEALLDRLEEERREAREALRARQAAQVSRDAARATSDTGTREATGPAPAPTPAPAPAASGGAAAAVQYAMAQVGDSYVYGAAGPDAFDCSGLTMMAWAQGGVSLPHSSSAQMGSGTPVSSSALQPGDLVFYYSPVSHVGIYVGGGMIVHAANPSTGVNTAPVGSMPIAGAVRPG
jgi:cell wall-associated NlpC family hydrolase